MINERTFLELQQAFSTAWSGHNDGCREADYILADRPVRVRTVGQQLSRCVDQPFAHLRTADARVHSLQLVIDLWDQQETGVACPQSPIPDGSADRPIAAFSQDGQFFFESLGTSVSCLDRAARHVVGCTRAADRLSLYELGRPLHTPLTVWHNDFDVPVIHAGMVSEKGHGVLLVGPPGAGKSTAAVTCLLAGLSFSSDDRLGLESAPDGSFVGHSLYASTTLQAEHLKRFPLIRPYASASAYPTEDKRLVLLAQVLPQGLARAATVRAVALLRVALDDRPARIRTATKAEALLALAPTSLLVGTTSYGFRGFDRLVGLVKSVPCYWLELGSDLNEIPKRVRELLSEAAL